VGLAAGSTSARGALELILGRLLRLALRASFLRAWSQRSGRWLAVAAGVAIVRLFRRSGERSRQRSRPDAA
jgi:hypothetical protein